MRWAKTLVGIVTVVEALAGAQALAAPTSCDIVSGASCSHNEGCDCDHDGYVRESGKAWKYCHWTKCPIDVNDSDPNALGKVSTYNADGDAWTTAYDCDDHDACVVKDCSNVCGPEPVDDDGDGAPEGIDCDDTNPYIKPGAPLACCSCDVLVDPSKVQAFGCAANPCPLGTPPPVDTGGADAGAPPADTGAAPVDSGGSVPEDAATWPSDALPWADVADGAAPPRYVAPPSDPGVIGSGVVVHREPPSPVGCTGGAAPTWGALAGLGLLGALRRGRARRAAGRLAVAATVVAGLGAAGCATVEPWERGRLAKDPMIFGADGWSDGLEQHFLQYREGAVGGFGGGGGGCGCN